MFIDSLTLKISDYDFDNESHLDNRAAIHFISSDYTRTQTLDEKDNGQGWAGVSGGGGVAWQKKLLSNNLILTPT